MHCENSKSCIMLLGQIMLHAANLGPIMHHALLIIWFPSRVMENHFVTLLSVDVNFLVTNKLCRVLFLFKCCHNIHVHVVID